MNHTTVIDENGNWPNSGTALDWYRLQLKLLRRAASETAEQRVQELRLFYGALELLQEAGRAVEVAELFAAADRRETRQKNPS